MWNSRKLKMKQQETEYIYKLQFKKVWSPRNKTKTQQCGRRRRGGRGGREFTHHDANQA